MHSQDYCIWYIKYSYFTRICILINSPTIFEDFKVFHDDANEGSYSIQVFVDYEQTDISQNQSPSFEIFTDSAVVYFIEKVD
jgi:hypothetical protein